jgi:hypothetical protein
MRGLFMEMYIYLIFILIGLALAFYGRRIMETIAFVIGAIVGANLAFLIAQNPKVQEYVADYMTAETCIIVAVIIGALIGGYLGRSFMYGMISMMFAGSCAYIASMFTDNYMVILVVFFIVLIIMWFLVEQFLAVVTAMLGGWLAGVGVFGLTFSYGFIALVLCFIVAGALAIFGARYQLDND